MPKSVVDLLNCCGGPSVGVGVLRCGKYCLCASSDVYGRKEMIGALRTKRGRWGKFYPCSMKLCIYGQQRTCLLCRLVLVIFLFILPMLIRWLILYTPSVLRDTLRLL